MEKYSIPYVLQLLNPVLRLSVHIYLHNYILMLLILLRKIWL